ncbi:MAG: sigma 54-interacting transcriptional regulator [Firmicutes bacterium]|nr:sigma 54-interacting transcriptional regulator [Bacillota bacterium]
MGDIEKLFKDKGYIEGITIINVEGEILFSAKFNSKMSHTPVNYETVGKKFLDVYENLDENNSSTYRAMRNGVPVYVEDQELVSAGKAPIHISSLSVPIKSGGSIVGAIDLSVTSDGQKDADSVEIRDEVLYAYNKVDSLRRADDKAIYNLEDIQTCDPKMIELKDNVKKFAQSDLPVLIYGETGTGKELVAHSIHQCSRRSKKPFVAQNCASIPANLIESILFGTSRGAFTGAVDNTGLLELADGGTLFLDEINSMPMELQPKILRVIQDGTFRRVGGKDVRHVDVRIISSTNEKLENIISENRFRADLYYRLAVLVLEIPGLSQRKKDIPLLTNYFIGKYCNTFGRKIRKVAPEVYEALARCQWPGNVRELESVVASAVCMADEHSENLEYRHFANRLNFAQKEEPSDDSMLPDSGDLTDLVSEYEKRLIKRALADTDGNITKAAVILNVPRQTLSRKVKDYGL